MRRMERILRHHSARFEQHCEGSPLALVGSIYYNSPVVPEGPAPVVRSAQFAPKREDYRNLLLTGS